MCFSWYHLLSSLGYLGCYIHCLIQNKNVPVIPCPKRKNNILLQGLFMSPPRPVRSQSPFSWAWCSSPGSGSPGLTGSSLVLTPFLVCILTASPFCSTKEMQLKLTQNTRPYTRCWGILLWEAILATWPWHQNGMKCLAQNIKNSLLYLWSSSLFLNTRYGMDVCWKEEGQYDMLPRWSLDCRFMDKGDMIYFESIIIVAVSSSQG